MITCLRLERNGKEYEKPDDDANLYNIASWMWAERKLVLAK